MRHTVEPFDAGKRLDHLLHERLPAFSRSRIQRWIHDGLVLVNGVPARASHQVRAGEAVDVEPAEAPPLRAEPEAIPLSVLYEDDDVVAIDKPAGMVVHAGAGVHSGTLVNALLHRFGALSGVAGALSAVSPACNSAGASRPVSRARNATSLSGRLASASSSSGRDRKSED